MNEKLLKLLIAAGLPTGLATTLATIVKVEKDEDIEATAKSIIDNAGTGAAQAEIDRRVTQAVKTAIENYEKKHNLKDGKPVDPEPDPNKNKGGEPPAGGNPQTNPELLELVKSVKDLAGIVQGIQQKTQAEERKSKILKALSDAKIPETFQKRFTIKDDATDEELETAVKEYKQELIDAGIAGLKVPGVGNNGKTIVEQTAEIAAKSRNTDNPESTGGVQVKKL